MEHLLEIANKQMDEMESLLSKDDELTYEEDEKLQELYQEIKENLEESSDIILRFRDDEKEIRALSKSKKRFENLCNQFDTPDDIIDETMNDMFPDEDSMEGFNWTRD